VRSVIQRVSRASVTVDGDLTGQIGTGLLVLLGVEDGDSEEQAAWLADRIARLRIFPDEHGKFDRSLQDVGGDMLVVSQFTLLGDCRKGTRPSFTRAAAPDQAEQLYQRFCELAAATGVGVQTGRFAAHMDVELVNDGPVTIVLDRAPERH
jgi:D-tyrosyl-tRNA(Tyr) deacylase